MLLSMLASYPVKSLGGQVWSSAPLDFRGITGDRRWMLVDEDHRFLTRRQAPAMARIAARQTATGLTLSYANQQCEATTPDGGAPAVEATIWRDQIAVRLGNDAADAFLSRALGRTVRLAHQYADSCRRIDHPRARADDQVSLADGFPLLLTTTASLDALNARLTRPVTMAHFRPNLVVEGAEPWAEDRWRRLRIGEVELRVARPCSRCIVVTQEPDSGERLRGNEPLSTLRTMGRSVPGGIMFGQNAIPDLLGTLRVGQEVEVLEEGDTNVAGAGEPR